MSVGQHFLNRIILSWPLCSFLDRMVCSFGSGQNYFPFPICVEPWTSTYKSWTVVGKLHKMKLLFNCSSLILPSYQKAIFSCLDAGSCCCSKMLHGIVISLQLPPPSSVHLVTNSDLNSSPFENVIKWFANIPILSNMLFVRFVRQSQLSKEGALDLSSVASSVVQDTLL